MRERFETRLEELGKEYEKGLNELRELETRQATLRQTMLRISGAIQVIEEELKRPDPGAASDQPSDQAMDLEKEGVLTT